MSIIDNVILLVICIGVIIGELWVLFWKMPTEEADSGWVILAAAGLVVFPPCLFATIWLVKQLVYPIS